MRRSDHMHQTLSAVSVAVIEGKLEAIASLTQQALSEGLEAKTILESGLMPGMDHVGAEFKAGNMFVPEVLRSARVMLAGLEILRPLLVQSGAKMAGRIVLGTVRGDLHDIGKNLVGMMCEGVGFEVKDVGNDVPPEEFVAAVKEFSPDIVAMSALLTTTMRAMEETIKALQAAGVRDKVKIMIGGAPVTQLFADQIGADGYASNAASASELARKLVGSCRG
jgi:5-methyltetrahydrofolate--homocysteine methyltransferase